jgi:hypothetical protein
MNNLETTVVVNLFGSKYTIGYPTIQQTIDIENMKQLLTAGNYGVLARNKTKQSEQALEFVDAVATFITMIPTFSKLFPSGDKDIMNLDIFKAKEMTKQFVEVFWPWYEQVEKAMNEPIKKDADQAA